MSFTFTNNPANDNRDAIRVMLNDTSSGSALLTDETIDWLLSTEANVYYAAAAAVDTLLGRSLGDVTMKKVGDLVISKAGDQDRYRTLAKQFRAIGAKRASPHAGGISDADKKTQRSDSDYDLPFARRGQFDNHGTGGSSSTSVYR